MIKEIFVVLLFTAFCITCILLVGWPAQHVTVKYDCSIAEISPDYPVEVKEACRKRNIK